MRMCFAWPRTGMLLGLRQRGGVIDFKSEVTMDRILAQGRLVFVAAIVALGAEHLIFARAPGPVLQIIPWIPAYPGLIYLVGTALIVAGICIVANFQARRAAALLGVFYLTAAVALQLPKAIAKPFDIGVRTGVLEPLALAGAAFVLARSTEPHRIYLEPWAGRLDKLLRTGRYLFAFSCVIFGIDHFPILRFIASLIPPWFPGGMFWAVVTGAALIAAGLSIALRRADRWTAALLGLMFLIWFLFLHLPRVMTYPRSHDPDEWSSALIALGMCGACWIVALDSARSRAADTVRSGRLPSLDHVPDAASEYGAAKRLGYETAL
jgi:uncharacterized membrane protein YphA (DoxX/SURF4 family)